MPDAAGETGGGCEDAVPDAKPVAVIALVGALYLARAFFVPLLIGILASYALSPVVEWLKAIHIPRPVAAALVLAVLAGSSSWVAYSLSDDAAAMIERLPEPYHEALILSELQGLSQKDIAEKQGISLPGAKSRVQRGRRKLKKLMLECCHYEFDRRGAVYEYERKKDHCGAC